MGETRFNRRNKRQFGSAAKSKKVGEREERIYEMSRPRISNEQRLARLRERWAKQAAERRADTAAAKAFLTDKGRTHKSRSGVKDRGEKLISPYAMQVAERYFWRRRGFTSPPVTSGGVMA